MSLRNPLVTGVDRIYQFSSIAFSLEIFSRLKCTRILYPTNGYFDIFGFREIKRKRSKTHDSNSCELPERVA